jgi:UDP-N-acetyl-D-glucosamine dehydrogenase
MENKTLAVVGMGYVGLPLAVQAAIKGWTVTGIDIDEEKVNEINKGNVPFGDKLLELELNKVKIIATSDFKQVRGQDVVVVCVPTPIFDNKLPNYGPLENACKNIALRLTRGTLVIIESTVNPGVCEEIVLPILEKYSGIERSEILLAHCPERINPGDDSWRVANIPRVVGGLNQESTKLAFDFYRSIIDAEIRQMGSLKEAEAVKIVENSFRNINIAFVNELAQSFSKLGIDVVKVIEGAATKPFAFMAHFPGCGVGGHCIPVDPYYLIDYAKKNGYKHRFLSLACKVNEEMPEYTVELLRQELEKQEKYLEGAHVAVLGLSYKANIGDVRESPSFRIIETLKASGVGVKVYDPFVSDEHSVDNFDSTLEGVDAIIVATGHDKFLDLSPKDLANRKIKILIDGRNCLNKDDFIDAGISYRGIGR